jgi:hypothetical protein
LTRFVQQTRPQPPVSRQTHPVAAIAKTLGHLAD